MDLEWAQSDDLCRVKGANEFNSTDAQFALAGFDLVVLHPSGLIRHCAVNPLALHRDRGGDVTHHTINNS